MLVVVSFAVQVGGAIALRHHDPARSLDLFGVLLIGIGPLLLWWRRTFPVVVLLSVFASTLAYDLTDQPRGPIWLALSIAFVTVMMARRRLIAWAVLIVGYALFLARRGTLGSADRRPMGSGAVFRKARIGVQLLLHGASLVTQPYVLLSPVAVDVSPCR